MRFLTLTIATLVLASPVAAQAGQTTQTSPLARPADLRDPNTVVCKRQEVTGSLIQGRKICMTRAQWEAQSRAAQSDAEKAIEHGQINSCGATTPGVC